MLMQCSKSWFDKDSYYYFASLRIAILLFQPNLNLVLSATAAATAASAAAAAATAAGQTGKCFPKPASRLAVCQL